MKLLVFDVEGTIFKTSYKIPGVEMTSTIWHALAKTLGDKALAEEVATHEKWKSGEYASYTEWMLASIRIHEKYGLSRDAFESIVQSAEFNDGVAEFFELFDRRKYIPAFISGGFQNLSQRAQVTLKVHHSFSACTYFFDDNGISGFNLIPSDFSKKIDFVRLLCREYELSADDWIFIGDGKNDVDIATRAPLSFAINPHPELRRVVDHEIVGFMDLAKYIF